MLAPAAMLVALLGMTASARVYYKTHRFEPGAAVLSDFQDGEENPRGYGYAALGTALACALLFPAAPLFRRALRGAWCRAGTWAYGVGSASGVAMAALEPFRGLDYGVHIALAFVTFLGMAGGLGCVSVAAAKARLRPGRRVWAVAAMIEMVAVLLALGVIPLPKRGAAGLWNSLAAGELALMVLIGAGTAGLAEACGRDHAP